MSLCISACQLDSMPSCVGKGAEAQVEVSSLQDWFIFFVLV